MPAAEIIHAAHTTADTDQAGAFAAHIAAAAPSGSLATTQSSGATEQLNTATATAADISPSCLDRDTEQFDTATTVAADTGPPCLDRDPAEGSSASAELGAAAAQSAAAGLEDGNGSSPNQGVSDVLESTVQSLSSAPVAVGHELSMADIQLPDREPAITQEANAA